ncbi:ABC transporter ATP-binding protein [Nordella sp. HKS 07]|uniref:ABC transporter ATP-binding protein n=1 Tax=Nordella sp. HKS 07 TaxID=2712222 RepID=UPI0013E19962|nr:ABC transporter ATP-binding protein [Nordella sp. HKS 07]QIG48868.1 ABC transporter ATP-binding protein [Nordella sp. HKS 07]
MATSQENPILAVNGLSKSFAGRHSALKAACGIPVPRLVALDDVSLSVGRNEVLGIVGESGSGKSTIARSIIRLERPDRGTVSFDGQDVWQAKGAGLRQIRKDMQMIYQDPYGSLNPRMSIGRAISEPALVHGLIDRAGVRSLVRDLLERVGLPQSSAELSPHALSGGQRQRVAIARALALKPRVIIADEAVSALDVSIQAQILNLFSELVRDLGLSMIFISHQLSVIAHLADRVAVMYLGRIVETGGTADVFTRPRHPYTAALLKAHPDLAAKASREAALTGEIPSSFAIPSGCRFNTRCRYAEARCFASEPPATEFEAGHRTWCHVLPTLAGITAT